MLFLDLTLCSQVASQKSRVQMVLLERAGINQKLEKQKDPIKQYIACF